jgi:O-antigen biosynthesis protein
MSRKRLRHIRTIAREGPGEVLYAALRARRRRRNVADDPVLVDPVFDLEPADLEANARVLREYEDRDSLEIATVQWFLPWFHLAHGGGVHTVLRFADRFAREHGVENRFAVYDRDDEAAAGDVAEKIARAFPGLRGAPVTAGPVPPRPADAAIATAWPGAFPLARFDRTRAKFFLVQDWEPDFHPAGSVSALLAQAARLGIPGLVNTPGLADVYRAHGNPAIAFRPAPDARYAPPPQPRPDSPVRVFFYGRPRVARNAFGLGLAALRRVKERLGDEVEIVCAGEDWSPGQYGAADVLANLGMLEDPDAVADLYRTCHVGLVFMLTRHPSYQPLEWMASGVATVTNESPHTAWLLRHGVNALLSRPLPALVAEQVVRAATDPALRERIVANGLSEVRDLDWDTEIDRVFAYMTGRG